MTRYYTHIKSTLWLTVVITLVCISCRDKEPTSAQCDRAVIISDRNYRKAKDDTGFRITDVTITGNCMTIAYSHGGGCKEIETELVASENSVQNTLNLPYRELKLSIDDKDNCEALVMASEEFDISALQNEGNSTTIRLHKWDEDIVYTY